MKIRKGKVELNHADAAFHRSKSLIPKIVGFKIPKKRGTIVNFM